MHRPSRASDDVLLGSCTGIEAASDEGKESGDKFLLEFEIQRQNDIPRTSIGAEKNRNNRFDFSLFNQVVENVGHFHSIQIDRGVEQVQCGIRRITIRLISVG